MFVPLALLDFLNSREDALLFWLIVGIGLALYKIPALRPSVVEVVRSLFARKLLTLWIAIGVYTTAVVFVAERIDWWHTASLKETAYWFFGTGLILTGRATQTRGNPAEFKRLLRRALKLTLYLEFFVNFWAFPLAVELVFIPLMALIVTMNVVAEREPSFAAVNRLIEHVFLIIGVGLVTFVAVSAVADIDVVFSRETMERLLVAPALTVASIPFLYLVALWSTYELVFMRVKIFVKDKRLARQTKRAIIRSCRLSLRRIGHFHGDFFSMLRWVHDESDVPELVGVFEAELRTDGAFGSR